VEAQASLSDALNAMLGAANNVAIVIDADGAYQGVVDIETLNRSVREMRTAEGYDERGGQPSP
jgi:osmoprotectant transport system ATP-binding protein